MEKIYWGFLLHGKVILIFFLGGFHFCVHFSCCTERILQWEDCRKRDFMSRDLLQSPLSTSQSVMFWRLVISSLSQQCIHCYVWRVVVIISPLSTLQSFVSRRDVIISPLSTPQSYVLETCDHLLLFCYWRVVICSIRLKCCSIRACSRAYNQCFTHTLSFFLLVYEDFKTWYRVGKLSWANTQSSTAVEDGSEGTNSHQQSNSWICWIVPSPVIT